MTNKDDLQLTMGDSMGEDQLSPEDREKLRMNVMKAQAVRQAMFEVVGESRTEIIKRARAKLVSMGIQLADSDVADQL